CSKVIDPARLDELEEEAAIVLCQMEMYFPPSFFDIMVHLIIHVVGEIRSVGLFSSGHSGITPDKAANAAELNNDVPKQDPLHELIKTLVEIYDKPVEFVWDLTKFGIPNVNSLLFLTYTNVSEITSGEKCLNIAILQFWTIGVMAWVIDRCMDSLSLNLYTMQRTDMGNVKNILKNGLRNRNDNCT
ncbi:hypothetical protein glysoja_039068, partial [Glycine soja]